MAVQILLSIAGTLCLFMLFLGTGSFLLARFDSSRSTSLLFTLVKIGLGFGVFGNLIMLLCFFGWASAPVIKGCTLVLFFASLPFVWMERNTVIRHAAWAYSLVRSAHPALGIALLLLFAGYALRGLLPPADFDGLMYHLASVKLFLAHCGFYHIYFNPQADFPLLTEMVFMAGLAFGNDILCKTMSFALGVMACGCIAVLCRRHCERPRLVVPALLVFLTLTNTIANLGNCYVDMPMAVWMLLAVLLMELYCESGLLRYAALAGIFGGMAMQTKIFGVIVLPLLFAQVFLVPKKNGSRFTLASACAVFLPALGLGLPWYIKSFVYNGTVLAIGHSAMVGQGLGNPMGVAAGSPAAYWLINVFGRIAAAPWTFSLFAHQHQSDTLGPLFIAVLPFLLFIEVPVRIRLLLAYAGIYLVEVLLVEMGFIQGGSSIRYSTLVMVLLSPVLVWTVSRMSGRPGLKRVLSLMVACMVVLGMALFVKRYHKEWKALATLASRDAYYASVLPEYPVIQKINSIRDGAVVMPVYNFSNYLIDAPYIASYRNYADIDEMKRDFKEKNVRYVFGNNVLDTTENRNPFPEIKEKELACSANGFYLYRILWK
jgi:hypothetical protein